MRRQNFSVLVEDYLVMRSNLGFGIERIRWLLRDFARFIGRIEHRGPITVDLAVQWALSSCSSDPARAERRLWAVRQFARHLAAFDPATEIPPAGLFGRVMRRSQPHIYSDAEITALLKECGRLRPRDGLRPMTYVALFSLLASTGLRISEACHLRCCDVDLCKGLLTVREGKFRKSRLVPLHQTTVQALIRYVARRNASRGAQRSEFFFHTDRASTLERAAAEKTFSRLRDRLGWAAQGGRGSTTCGIMRRT